MHDRRSLYNLDAHGRIQKQTERPSPTSYSRCCYMTRELQREGTSHQQVSTITAGRSCRGRQKGRGPTERTPRACNCDEKAGLRKKKAEETTHRVAQETQQSEAGEESSDDTPTCSPCSTTTDHRTVLLRSVWQCTQGGRREKKSKELGIIRSQHFTQRYDWK